MTTKRPSRRGRTGRREWFTFLCARFDVTAFRAHARRHDWPVYRVGLESIARLCNFAGVAEGTSLSLFAIDPKRAADLPAEALREPGIVVRFAESTLLIDGHHRAYRLWREGQESLPVYVFDDPEILAEYSNVPRRVLEGRAA